MALIVSLILTVVHVSPLVDCRQRLWEPEQHAGPSTMGSVKKGIDRDFLVTLPVKTDTSNFVSIFNLRRKRFLCVDLKGELHTSRQREKEDCLFLRIWLDLVNHNMGFYSQSVGQLLKRSGAEWHLEPHGPSSALLGPLVKRQRRSEEVNPSDPLRSQSRLSYFAKVHRKTTRMHPEQDQAGAVSKETITSCDDPLRVLQSSGPVSPVKTNFAGWAAKD